jgi:hypothetical protein
MDSLSRPIRCLTLTLSATAALLSICPAQEVASVDLTKVEARIDLRRPKATSDMTGGYSGAQSNTSCPDSAQKGGELDTSLDSLGRTHYQVGDEPKFEVVLHNTGSVPIRIPSSPNLADLQPKDPGKQFAYYELQIVLWIAADERWSTDAGGYAALYGNDDHANTMLTLEPGQWVRVIAKGHFRLDDSVTKLVGSVASANHAYAQTTLFRKETMITARQSATVAREVCVAQTHGQSVPIQLSIP